MTVRLFVRFMVPLFAASFSTLFGFAQAAKAGDAARPLELPTVAHVAECAGLKSIDVSNAVGAKTVVTATSIVDDGTTAAYCKVHVVVDEYANLDLHLPLTAWTQRLLFGGGPGGQAEGAVKLEQFVRASWEDLGHRNHEDDFAKNYDWRVNAGYRGMHWQVLAAKAIVGSFYGQPAKYSYYNACSEAGREGMMEVQRFPEDFDGVGAGCPPLNITVNNGIFEAWNVLTNVGADGSPILTADKLPILHKAILEQCDAADGLKDGIVSDPFSCHPNPDAVACKAGQDLATCLTPAQVRVAEELYRGAHDAKGGKLTPGGVLAGSELAWTATVIPNARTPIEGKSQTTTAIRGQFSDPALPITWELSELTFDRAWFDRITKDHFLYDAVNPDLSGFAKAGHKLLLWQAMGDTNVLPAHAVLYYLALQRQMGARAVDGFVRFYELPGVYHCGGGDGPVIADLLLPLMTWVERGIAPDVLPGVHVARAGGPGAGVGQAQAKSAQADLTRPIYPYPYTAKYTGTGDAKDAANWVRGPARPAPASLWDWFGSDFYTASYQRWCTGEGTTFVCKDKR